MSLGFWGNLTALATAEGSGAAGAVAESGGAGTFWLPTQSAAGAAAHDALFYFIYYVTTAFFIAIIGAMIYFVWKYRQKSPDQKTSPIKGNHKLEFHWSFWPSILLMVMFVWGFKAYIETSVPPADALEVRVTASQWRWNFQYRNGCPSDRLVVPVDQPVRLTMTSTDVLHSVYVPAFRVKRDVVPGRYTVLWFEPTETGTFDLLCTEYCGNRHSAMYAQVDVVSPDDYQAYLDSYCGLSALSPEAYGEVLFNTILPCSQCHSVTEDGGATDGPRMFGAWGREEALDDGSSVVIDENYFRNSLINPNDEIVAGFRSGLMPSFRGQLEEDQIYALIEYVRSLNADDSAEPEQTEE